MIQQRRLKIGDFVVLTWSIFTGPVTYNIADQEGHNLLEKIFD